MALSLIKTRQKEIVTDYELNRNFQALKSSVIDLNNRYVEWLRQGDLATPFEKKQAKSAMQSLFEAVDTADEEVNGKRFVFEGDPIPPPSKPNHTALAEVKDTFSGKKFGDLNNAELVLGEEVSGQHVLIENALDSTIVVLEVSGAKPRSIHLQNLQNCGLFIQCDGPVIVHGAAASVMVVSCHQLRLHGATNSTIFANVENGRMVIENSRKVVLSGFNDNRLSSACYDVDDFDWPTVQTRNPHITVLSADDISDLSTTCDGITRAQSLLDRVVSVSSRSDQPS